MTFWSTVGANVTALFLVGAFLWAAEYCLKKLRAWYGKAILYWTIRHSLDEDRHD